MLCESEFLGTVGVDVGAVLNEINHVLTRVQKQKKTLGWLWGSNQGSSD
jgi:hypothetical protein